MNSSPTSTTDASARAWLAGDAGVRLDLTAGVDPIDAWIDLMAAIEALCPRWPEPRPTVGSDYRL